jgi:ribosomal protein S6
MPLYELIYFIRPNASLAEVANCMKLKANIVFNNGGVIRRLDNQGILPLAYPMFRHREKHFKGRWIIMLFDGSPKCVTELNQHIGADMNVFRWVFYKQKDALRDIYAENIPTEGKFRGEDDIKDRHKMEQKALVRSVMAKIQNAKRRYHWDKYQEYVKQNV